MALLSWDASQLQDYTRKLRDKLRPWPSAQYFARTSGIIGGLVDSQALLHSRLQAFLKHLDTQHADIAATQKWLQAKLDELARQTLQELQGLELGAVMQDPETNKRYQLTDITYCQEAPSLTLELRYIQKTGALGANRWRSILLKPPCPVTPEAMPAVDAHALSRSAMAALGRSILTSKD
jgi:hypothetical protein